MCMNNNLTTHTTMMTTTIMMMTMVTCDKCTVAGALEMTS